MIIRTNYKPVEKSFKQNLKIQSIREIAHTLKNQIIFFASTISIFNLTMFYFVKAKTLLLTLIWVSERFFG